MKALLIAALVAVAAVSAQAESITAKTCSASDCSSDCQVGTFETGVCTSANNGAYMLGSCDNGVAAVKLFTTADCSGSPLPFSVGNTCGLLYSGIYSVAQCGAAKKVQL